MVALELKSGRSIRLWRNDLLRLGAAPFDTGSNSLFVAYAASAEIGCFLALGWPPPERVLDLYAEARVELNGIPMKFSLLSVLKFFKLVAMDGEEKAEMRSLILSGGPWSAAEREAILDYCFEDVLALRRLLPCVLNRMGPNPIRLGQALLRGRYMIAAARIERIGIPVDVRNLDRINENWDALKLALIADVNRAYGVYDGTTFKAALFKRYLNKAGIQWPRLASGALQLDRKTFQTMAERYPKLMALYELRVALSEMRLNNLPVGLDGRNRTGLVTFRSKTGRNQPSNTKFIFGTAKWQRSLIKPAPRMAVAYLDWSGQEIALAGALSGDSVLMESYASGDPYIDFAKRIGMVPETATKHTHPFERQVCKAMVLGILFGMTEYGLALRAEITLPEARALLRRHRETYPTFWQWSENIVNKALIGGALRTRFGWQIRQPRFEQPNPRSLMNFPMQANGAEMMRLAACEATEAGLQICAPVHDAFLLEAPLNRIEDDVKQLHQIMERVSELVMGVPGFLCRVDAEIIRYPDRYRDERGMEMWNRVMRLLDELEQPGLAAE